MTSGLADKVAVVTGGASGIGLATVKAFLREGAKVVIADIDPNGANIAAALGTDVRFRRTDVAERGDVEALVATAVAEFGRLDVMFNNAGISSFLGRLLDDPLDDFNRVMQVDALGVLLGIQVAARQMIEQGGGGSIINTASMAGSVASFGVTNYRAAKAAVIHSTRCAAIELGEHDIRVNCITPALIETELTRQMSVMPDVPAAISPLLGAAMDEIMASIKPLRRTGHVDDVAKAALFFASDMSAFVTGTVLPVDGGSSAGSATNLIDQFAQARERLLKKLD